MNPTSDTKRFRLPVVTLVIVAGALFGAFSSLISPDLLDQFGFSASHPTLASVFVSPFLHANLLHLLGNLIFVVAVGGSLELAAGSGRFAVVYFASALGGEAMHWTALHNSVHPTPLVGASAAVAGCAAYYSLRYYRLRIPAAPKVTLSVLTITAIWALLQGIGAFVHIGDSHAASAYWSHLGGLVVGIILFLTFRAPDLVQEKLDQEVLDEARLHGPAALLGAAKLRAKSQPKDETALHQWAEAAHDLGLPEEEAAALGQLTGVCPDPEKAECIRRLAALRRLSVIPDSRRMVLAAGLEGSHLDAAVLIWDSVGGDKSSPHQAEALFAIADRLYKTDRPRAEKALTRLHEECSQHPLHTQARARGWIQ